MVEHLLSDAPAQTFVSLLTRSSTGRPTVTVRLVARHRITLHNVLYMRLTRHRPDYCNTQHVSILHLDYCNSQHLSIFHVDYCNTQHVSIFHVDYCNSQHISIFHVDYCNTQHIAIFQVDYCNSQHLSICQCSFIIIITLRYGIVVFNVPLDTL